MTRRIIPVYKKGEIYRGKLRGGGGKPLGGKVVPITGGNPEGNAGKQKKEQNRHTESALPHGGGGGKEKKRLGKRCYYHAGTQGV